MFFACGDCLTEASFGSFPNQIGFVNGISP